jgi:hypothetical protein
VDRDLGKDTGPFWDFAAAVWPHVFGKGRYGLSAAMKNWEKKKRHPRYGGSPFIRNTWGIFNHSSTIAPM